MKLDMGKAWNSAMEMIGANRDVMLILVGVFVFLPNFAFALYLGDSTELLQAQAAGDPEQAMETMLAFYRDLALPMVLISLVQGVGTMALLSLLNDSGRPTVGEAIRIGLICLLPYFAAQLIQGFIMGLAILIPVVIGIETNSVAVGVLIGLVALVAIIYVSVKFSLVAPVLAIEGIRNPITALQRSWSLTKGNSVLLFAFYLLLVLAFLIVSAVISLVIGVAFALAGPEVAVIGNGLVSSAIAAVMVMVMVGVLAAIHRQLSGGSTTTYSEAFE